MTAAGSAVTAVLLLLAACMPGASYRVDRDGIPLPLDGLTGDAVRGRALVVARDPANCVLCHGMPGIAVSGDLGPPLQGVGKRLTVAQLRLRVVDERRVQPQTIMPSYHVATGLTDVAAAYRGMPILTAQQVEDVVAYLATLR